MMVEFAFGVVEIDDEPVFGGAITTQDVDNPDLPGRYCLHCLEEIHVPDDRTGLIHAHGKYRCFTYNENGKPIPLSTVAE